MDVFNPTIVDVIKGNCLSFLCLLITRDVTELNVPSYELQELTEEEIVHMFKVTYKLKDKLTDEEFGELTKKCYGLPIVVNLLAARFRKHKTKREIQAEFKIINDIKLIDMNVSNRYKAVSKLFGFSLEQLKE